MGILDIRWRWSIALVSMCTSIRFNFCATYAVIITTQVANEQDHHHVQICDKIYKYI